ncbi:hypothetical protein COP2_009989 [Malus domestica]
MSFFNWWSFGLCCGLLLGVTVVVYVQDRGSWGVADVVVTAVMAVSLAIFIIGRRNYRYRKPTGSPFTPMLQVLVAAIAKRNQPHASDPAQLYETPKSEKVHGRLLCHTRKLRFLDKAVIISAQNLAENPSPWRLATVTKVEKMKFVLNLIPIWLATLPFGVCVAQSSTYFIKQGATMNREVANGFEVPPASIFALAAIGIIASVTIYEKLLVPILRRTTGNERGINILQRIGIGMIFSITTMVAAALVEKKLLGFVKSDPIKGVFYDQVPDSMRSLGIAFYLSVIGAGNFVSSFVITAVDHITDNGGKSWLGKDLNNSRLDRFYWLLACMAAANLCVYVFAARHYSYKNVQKVAVADCFGDELENRGPIP